MEKISAIIPTFNEEDNILDAIESVSWADEILVVDSFSEDKTVEIAKSKNARVIQRAYENSASQKNWAIPQASYFWIFLLDADERCTESLQKEIRETIDLNEGIDAYWIKRENYFMGKKVKYSGWGNDKVIRLFKRDTCKYENKSVHAEIVTKGRVSKLKEVIKHNTYKNMSHYFAKIDRYSTYAAKDLVKKHSRVSLYHLWFKPSWRFFKHYVLNLGILDGKVGYIISRMSAIDVFLRFTKVKELVDKKT